MLNLRIGQHRDITPGVSHQFGAAHVLPGIRTDIRIAEAFAAGKPVREHAPWSRAAFDYSLVALKIESLWCDG
jgi:chromosome partitioning protein